MRIRLHVFFLLFAVQAIYMATLARERGMVAIAAASLLILLVSVLLHEAGHCWMAVRVGGYADQVVLWPLGGLEPPHIPHEPQFELQTALAGPMVNATIMVLTAPFLLILGAQNMWGLFVPLAPAGLTEGPALVIGLKLVFWINWLLVLVNLLPAFPFDGGRVMRALLWAQFDYRTAVIWLARMAMVASFGICVLAWLMKDTYATAFVPAWVPLLLFAIFLWFGAQQEVSRLENGNGEDDFFGYDFSQGYTSLERDVPRQKTGPGLIRRWLEERREAKRLRQAEIELQDEQQVDAILARLHAGGMAGLTPQERALLDRVSERYRNRQQS